MKALKVLESILETVAIILLFSVFVLTILQLVFRNINIPLAWTEALARLTFVWLIFLIMPLITMKRRHIRIFFFVDFLPEKAQKLLYILTSFVIAAIFIITCLGGTQVIRIAWRMTNPALRTPEGLLYLPVWLGLMGSAIVEIFNGLSELRGMITKRGNGS